MRNHRLNRKRREACMAAIAQKRIYKLVMKKYDTWATKQMSPWDVLAGLL